MSENSSHKIGKSGEERAVVYLKGKGYQIVARNFHSAQGEIDIVARNQDFLIFVEVKNYSFRNYGYPLGAVRRHKKQCLIHAAQTYLSKNRIKNINCRFDLIAIYRKFNDYLDIQHIENAFQLN